MKKIAFILSIVFLSCTESCQNKHEENESFGFDFKAEDFKAFYELFKTDSVFQMSRVRFPIKGKYQDYAEQREWTKENWSLMTWDFRNTMKNPDDSVSIIQDTSKFFFGTYCKECGFSFEMQFDKIDGQWFLTYRQENNY